MPAIEEMQVINHILNTGDLGLVNEYGIGIDHFPIYGQIYKFIVDFYENHKKVPSIDTVASNFDDFERVTVDSIEHAVEVLQEDWLHRQLKPLLKISASKIADKKSDEALTILRDGLEKIYTHSLPKKVKGYSYIMNASERKERYQKIHGTTESMGYSTGIAQLDEITGGLLSGRQTDEADYFLVMAPSHMGKTLITSFMMISGWMNEQEDYPAYFSLEQTAKEIARMWDSFLAKVSSVGITRGRLDYEQKLKYEQFLDKLAQSRKDVVIYDLSANNGRSYTVEDIRRILVTEGHTRFALDQLSKVQPTTRTNIRERIFDTSAEIRNMILTTGIPGFVVAQANREAAKKARKGDPNEEITGEDVGESYSIYQDASKAIAVTKIDEKTFKIKVIKNRNNLNCGDPILLRYDSSQGILYPLTTYSGESYF